MWQVAAVAFVGGVLAYVVHASRHGAKQLELKEAGLPYDPRPFYADRNRFLMGALKTAAKFGLGALRTELVGLGELGDVDAAKTGTLAKRLRDLGVTQFEIEADDTVRIRSWEEFRALKDLAGDEIVSWVDQNEAVVAFTFKMGSVLVGIYKEDVPG